MTDEYRRGYRDGWKAGLDDAAELLQLVIDEREADLQAIARARVDAMMEGIANGVGMA